MYQFGSGFKQYIYKWINKAYQGQTVNAEGLTWMGWMATKIISSHWKAISLNQRHTFKSTGGNTLKTIASNPVSEEADVRKQEGSLGPES